ncbi:ATP-grasp domain-containing protein [Kitasatospora sp. NPDC052868]|uniref:ATP-grasp domain-containing protein n=1 Tax=Kitasatospora sp. NPDC052868 TaxID=3364060 RepID=UPI0037CAFB72
MTTDVLLLLAPRINETGLQLLTAARRRGLRAHTAAAWRVPEGLLGPHGLDDQAGQAPSVHLYGGPLFGDAVGGALGLALLEPPDGWLTGLPFELTRRRVACVPLAEARRLRRPAFLKPPADKFFPARVYPDGSGLPGPDALDDAIPVLVSDVVRFRREYRLFVLDGVVRTASRYALDGELSVAPLDGDPYRAAVLRFGAEVLASSAGSLPSAVVVDVGLLGDGPDGPSGSDGPDGPDGQPGWAVVEANAAWASGGYACDAAAVLDVVLRAAGPAAALAPADRPYCRELPEVVG